MNDSAQPITISASGQLVHEGKRSGSVPEQVRSSMWHKLVAMILIVAMPAPAVMCGDLRECGQFAGLNRDGTFQADFQATESGLICVHFGPVFDKMRRRLREIHHL